MGDLNDLKCSVCGELVHHHSPADTKACAAKEYDRIAKEQAARQAQRDKLPWITERMRVHTKDALETMLPHFEEGSTEHHALCVVLELLGED